MPNRGKPQVYSDLRQGGRSGRKETCQVGCQGGDQKARAGQDSGCPGRPEKGDYPRHICQAFEGGEVRKGEEGERQEEQQIVF